MASPTWNSSSKQVICFLPKFIPVPVGHQALLTDQGTHFTSRETQQWTRQRYIWNFHPGYHPLAAGPTEHLKDTLLL